MLALKVFFFLGWKYTGQNHDVSCGKQRHYYYYYYTQALEEKYDALRDKLLMEALIAQLGETEWRLLSEQERQRRLMQLKLEERRLRQEGQWVRGHVGSEVIRGHLRSGHCTA